MFIIHLLSVMVIIPPGVKKNHRLKSDLSDLGRGYVIVPRRVDSDDLSTFTFFHMFYPIVALRQVKGQFIVFSRDSWGV